MSTAVTIVRTTVRTYYPVVTAVSASVRMVTISKTIKINQEGKIHSGLETYPVAEVVLEWN